MDRYKKVLEYRKIPDGKYTLIERNEKGERRFTIFDENATRTLYETAGKSLVEKVREGRE